ncbi:MAG: TRAP transporter small permease subunit, partial [Tagaea sp.]
VCGIALAMREDAHVRVDLLSDGWSARRRAWVALWCHALFVLPWMAAIAWFGWPIVRRGFAALERFPETFSPGYFLLKALILVLAFLVSVQALAGIARAIAVLRGGDGR